MQVKDVIIHLAHKARLVFKSRSDDRFLRFYGKDRLRLSFIINNMSVVGYRYFINGPIGSSEKFDICNPDSLTRILSFMRDD